MISNPQKAEVEQRGLRELAHFCHRVPVQGGWRVSQLLEPRPDVPSVLGGMWVKIAIKIPSHAGETRATFSDCYSKNNFRKTICLEIRVNGHLKHLFTYLYLHTASKEFVRYGAART